MSSLLLKKLYKVSALAVFFISVVFISCSNKQAQENLARIDSLETGLKKISMQLSSLDTQAIRRIMTSVGEETDRSGTFNPASLHRDTAILIANYRYIYKRLNKRLPETDKIRTELSFSMHQLANLKKDVTGHLLSQEQFNQYFLAESSAIAMVAERIQALEVELNGILRQYNEIHEQASHAIATLAKDSTLKQAANVHSEEDDE